MGLGTRPHTIMAHVFIIVVRERMFDIPTFVRLLDLMFEGENSTYRLLLHVAGIQSRWRRKSSSASSETECSNCKKSDVCQKTEPKKAKCTLCEKTYAFDGGTSNLRDHLLQLHASNFKPKQQPRLDDFVIRGECPDSRAKRITELIADLVARDLCPAAVVEGDGFKVLLKFIEPGYKVPSATHIAHVVHRQHESAKVALKQKLKEDALSLAITSDLWTSCSNDAYISRTAHFISADWQMVLATSPFPEQHTRVNIAEKLKQIVISYGIDMKRVRAL